MPVEVPPEFDEGPTPLPMATAEAFDWWHFEQRLVRTENEIREASLKVTRHNELIDGWIKATSRCVDSLDKLIARQAASEAEIRGFLERDWKRFSDALDRIEDALGDLNVRVTGAEIEIKQLGKQQTEQAAKTVAHDQRLHALELDKRDKGVVVAERQRWFSLAKLAYAAIVAAIGIAGYLAGSQL